MCTLIRFVVEFLWGYNDVCMIGTEDVGVGSFTFRIVG